MAGQLLYKRVLLKLSGEALMGNAQFGIEQAVLQRIVADIKQLIALNVQVGIVIGGGNIIRGATQSKGSLTRATADQMGMLATVINCLALRDALLAAKIPTIVMSAIFMPGVAEAYDRSLAVRYLEQHKVVLFAGGTGNPFVTTDSAASLRAIEINADILLKATQVDGIYNADPVRNPQATRYTELTFDEAIQQQLGVMDATAFAQCREHKMPLRVFSVLKPGALLRIVQGEDEGTLVKR